MSHIRHVEVLEAISYFFLLLIIQEFSPLVCVGAARAVHHLNTTKEDKNAFR